MAFETERPSEDSAPTPQTSQDIRLLAREVVSMFVRPTLQVAEICDGAVYCVQGWEAPYIGGRALRVFWDRDNWQPRESSHETLQRPLGLHVQEVRQIIIEDGQGVGSPYVRHYSLAYNPSGISYGYQTEFMPELATTPDSYVALPFYFQQTDADGSLGPFISLEYLKGCGVDTTDQDSIDEFTAVAFSPLSREECRDLNLRLYGARHNSPTPENPV